MNSHYALINKMTTKPDKRHEVLTLLLEAGKPFADNPACRHYLVYKDMNDPNVIWVEDYWTNEADHAAAMSSPEMRSFITRCIPLLEGMPQQIPVELVGGKGL